MKKLLITGLFLLCCPVFANEMTEDYFDIATNYCIEGDYREAANYLDKILLIEPNNKNVQDLRNGLRQIIQGNNKSFILAKSPAVQKSINAKKTGNKELELSSLNTANDFWAYYFLGEYYKNTQNYNQAIESYIKSVNTKPTFIQCYLQIAVCYFELGNYAQAISYLNQYLKANPQDDFAYALRARAKSNLNNHNEALNDILTAIALENSIDYRFLEGKILYSMKRYSQAKTKLSALTNDIQTAEIYKYIGLCDYELGNYTDALMNLNKGIILSDDDKNLIKKYNEIKSRIEK